VKNRYKTIYELIKSFSNDTPNKIALESPEKQPITFKELTNDIDDIISVLSQLNLSAKKNKQRVAIIPFDGQETIMALMATMSCCTAAPLNRNYTTEEFEFYFTDLNIKALIAPEGVVSPAIKIAKKRKLPIITLSLLKDKKLIINVNNKITTKKVGQSNYSRLNDIALVLHTSGTTARPKIVPLTHLNISASVINMINSLKLSKTDKCLDVMPLFHIHGIITAMSSLCCGGGIVLPMKFDINNFWDWLKDFHPTWYTAGPTIHQAILLKSNIQKNVLNKINLRFIRSSTSPLPPKIFYELEKKFRAPISESYGMTEAALQITANPPIIGENKAGSAGKPVGLELAIIDNQDKFLKIRETGEIVIKGDNVLKAYEKNPEANKTSFIKGWFKTGDLGFLDKDGFLFINGRVKEMINKGGEKISPREIDEALLSHPKIESAVAFAIPHQSLSEDIGAAIILKKGIKDINRVELRRFLSKKITNFKIPNKIFTVEEIPKGPTGKLQRIGLYAKLKKTEKNKSPETQKGNIEKKIQKIWQKILKINSIKINDNFFEIGGDSLKTGELVNEINGVGFKISIDDILDNPTIEDLVKKLKK